VENNAKKYKRQQWFSGAVYSNVNIGLCWNTTTICKSVFKLTSVTLMLECTQQCPQFLLLQQFCLWSQFTLKFQVLTVAVMQTTVLWEATSCYLVEIDRLFGYSQCLHHRGGWWRAVSISEKLANCYESTQSNIQLTLLQQCA
jgi:hypothetical protein